MDSSSNSDNSYVYARITKSEKGKDVAVDGGYSYIVDRHRNSRYYWKCTEARKGCKGRLITYLISESEGDIDPKHNIVRSAAHLPHSHPPSPTYKARKDALSKMKKAAMETRDRPSNIIQDVQQDLSLDAGVGMPSKDAMSKLIRRARKDIREDPEPQSWDEIVIPQELQKTASTEDFVLDCSEVGSDFLIILTTLGSMRRLCSSPIIIMDGTFKVCPKLFRQLYTIHGQVGNQDNKRMVPLIYALMSSKTEELYRIFFDKLINNCNQNSLSLSPRYILTDSEIAVRNAVRIKFPYSKHRGCFFHLTQIIYRNVQKKGLQRIYSQDDDNFSIQIRKLFALAFMPYDIIPEAFEEIKENIGHNGQTIMEWFSKFYVNGFKRNDGIQVPPRYPPKMWSISDLIDANHPRTQNSLEAWHRRIGSLAGECHLGLYKCIELLNKEHYSVAIEIGGLGSGKKSSKKSNSIIQQREDRIRSVYTSRDSFDNTQEYLKALAQNMKINYVVEKEDDEDDE